MADPKIIRNPAPSLGVDIVGLAESELVLFRGIPFATVSERWTHSVTQHSLDTGVFDATKFGPRCCQAGGVVMISGGINDPTPGDDEFNCLNLNIATYTTSIGDNAKKLLPVMVWIHGYACIAPPSPRYCTDRRLVALSNVFLAGLSSLEPTPWPATDLRRC